MLINAPKYYGSNEYEKVRTLLIKTAAENRTVNYKDVFEAMGLSGGNYASKEAGYLLGEISERMVAEGKPMLSALVVAKVSGRPGSGFFNLAISPGELPVGATREQEEEFWSSEIKAIFTTEW